MPLRFLENRQTMYTKKKGLVTSLLLSLFLLIVLYLFVFIFVIE